MRRTLRDKNLAPAKHPRIDGKPTWSKQGDRESQYHQFDACAIRENQHEAD
ncbi:MAG TPA: hypothetical protein VJT15_05545 [Pyrinomonadaceae bacterium]|nr:hypothetical protein [Pyrinomonadaceae bacterium]